MSTSPSSLCAFSLSSLLPITEWERTAARDPSGNIHRESAALLWSRKGAEEEFGPRDPFRFWVAFFSCG
ncbi:hypothetical protein OPV22_012488 [Ensete ventricosum]|uniref:Secreted protein n=1 Tax=Ensete ventricosum TaxID=4639 RepID=A0AAV8R761_ENSVE|nr:hypothetical protein OPV22_012488 [Ensete ventricosum]